MTDLSAEKLETNTLQHQDQTKLRAVGISKVFEQGKHPLTVLDNVNLHIFPNEFVSIVGSSGCGKSTLLHIIAGLTPPTAGKVWMGSDLIDSAGRDRGMVFQSYTLFPWLTVAQNIGFGLKLQCRPKAEIKDRVRYYLAVVGLEKFASSYPKQLSGGMQQRVAIARALANQPEVLLMDEPFGALDAQTRGQMQAFFHDLWEQTYITVLMITHDIEEAVFLSQRVYIMKAHPGEIQAEVMINLPERRTLEDKLSQKFLKIKRDLVHQLHY